MSTINPILHSAAQTAYANLTAPEQKLDGKQADRLLEHETSKTSASGNETVTLSEAGLQRSNTEQEISAQQVIREKESVESSARQDEQNETASGLAYGSQINEII